MAFWSDVSWLAIGGYNAITNYSEHKQTSQAVGTIQTIIRSLTDPDIESLVRAMVYGADEGKFLEVWENIESFKRENFYLLIPYIGSSYWGYVGKERFPFTRDRLLNAINKKKLSRADEKMLATYRGWTITLIMNMYGKRSEMEATRIAYNQVYGGGSGSWTMEYG